MSHLSVSFETMIYILLRRDLFSSLPFYLSLYTHMYLLPSLYKASFPDCLYSHSPSLPPPLALRAKINQVLPLRQEATSSKSVPVTKRGKAVVVVVDEGQGGGVGGGGGG